jgi:predicted MPP superfamily phosphohydrolase
MAAGGVALRELEVVLPDLPATLTGLRIIHLSDLHADRWTARLAVLRDLLADLEADLCALTGDLIHRPSRWQEEVPHVLRVLEPLRGRLPVAAVFGNHDTADLQASLEQAEVDVLRDEARSYRFPDRRGTLWLTGVDQPSYATGDVEQALAGIEHDSPDEPASTILLAHVPSTVYRVPANRVQMQLSGHTHGGQYRIPGIGCLYNHDRIPLSASRGLSRINATTLHVSAGIGASGPMRFRLFCPPELTVLTLRSAPV